MSAADDGQSDPSAAAGAAPPKRLADDCFTLPPGVDWMPVDEALARLEAALRPCAGVERLDLAAAAGRILAEDAAAARAHPACDNAAVDGYAFAHPGLGADRECDFALAPGRAAPGAPWRARLPGGQALRILTGAAMPDGADTVVLQEDAALFGEGDAAGARRVQFRAPAKPGANRRRAGENLAIGDVALRAGARLTPQALGHLAAAGLPAAPVRRKLRVALFSTGDELIAPGEAGRPDQVVDSNRPMLAALLGAPWIEAVDFGRVPDRREAVEAALTEGAKRADAVIASGGASGGEEDHMGAALEASAAAGDAFHLWRIAMKPGRPMAMGLRRGAPVFGLPGNPVAAFVCFLIFVRPALLRLAGGPFAPARPVRVVSGFDYPKKPGRREYLRVRIGADGRLEKYRSEGSGLIEGLVWSDGLADLPHAAGPLRAGEPVAYLSYAALGIAP
ncbi:MAG: molybdopterin molybdotransferase MoeA [Pseudomonadota bacterium]